MAAQRYSSHELTSMADALESFHKKLEQLLECTTIFDSGFAGQWQVPLEGKEDNFKELKADLASLSGSAQSGIDASDSFIVTHDNNGNKVIVNPVKAWLSITQPHPILAADDVLSSARAAESKLRADAASARRDERSLAGRVAQLIRWPARVRELAGFPRDSPAGKITQWTVGAFLFAVITGVIGSALWTLIAGALSITP